MFIFFYFLVGLDISSTVAISGNSSLRISMTGSSCFLNEAVGFLPIPLVGRSLGSSDCYQPSFLVCYKVGYLNIKLMKYFFSRFFVTSTRFVSSYSSS